MLAEDDEGVAAVRARCLSVLADSHANAELRRTAERVLNKAAQTRLATGAAQHWHCQGCTLRNPVPAPVCAACGQARKVDADSSWACEACTCVNAARRVRCAACGTQKEGAQTKRRQSAAASVKRRGNAASAKPAWAVLEQQDDDFM